VIQDSIGEAYLEMGRPREALPWIAEPRKTERSNLLYIARHGYLLARTAISRGAQGSPSSSGTRRPATAEDAWWMGLLYRTLEQYEEPAARGSGGLVLAPRNKDLDAMELEALLRLNRLDEFEKVWSGMWKSERDTVTAFRLVADLGRRPAESLPAFEQAWAEAKLGPDMMAIAAKLVESGGKLEETRASIRGWLGAPARRAMRGSSRSHGSRRPSGPRSWTRISRTGPRWRPVSSACRACARSSTDEAIVA
jgi:hypothetical protein